jgi:hypothetical protein
MKFTFKAWHATTLLAAILLFAGLMFIPGASTTGAAQEEEEFQYKPPLPREFKTSPGPTVSGIYDVKDFNFGTDITECPQARLVKIFPEPLDRRIRDLVEQYSDGGNDLRTNEEYSCFPQNETSIAVNPTLEKNVVAGANDYRMGTGSSGVYASMDNGQKWYGSIIPFPTTPTQLSANVFTQGYLVSGGDPAVVFDRAGVAYYAQIAFNRNDDTNGVFVSRSTNGGYTWSRARVTVGAATPNPTIPNDGVVVFQADNNARPDASVTIHDKEYIAAGPRPAGVSPVCFDPVTKAPIPAGNPACPTSRIGVDRIYVTWSAFNNPIGAPGFIVSSTIEISYSDDRGTSWSPRRTISGSANFCVFAFDGSGCDDNQYSTPTVHPETGLLGVAFENFNTPDENQYLFVRSSDGGNTFQGPFFVTPVYDINFPRSGVAFGRPDCFQRGQQNGRIVYTNSCFRSNPGGNVVVDKRGGAFADDFYLVMSDNRNGTRASSNSDVFLFKSLDGGMTWIGPTRVNNDFSNLGTANRDSFTTGNFGNDQWWPWVDINKKGHLNVVMSDRRLDTDSTAHEWAALGSRQRPGNYLVWFWGAQCIVNSSTLGQCMAPGAALIPQPTVPINPGSGPQPGQGLAFLGPLRNFGITDTPSNWDYSFQNGIFAGDYNNVAVTPKNTKAYGFWTDARNGRSSSNPLPPGSFQTGRNPRCEQSDVMVQEYSSEGGSGGQESAKPEDAMFLVTPCPADGTTP